LKALDRDKMKQIAKELDIEITFDNTDDKCGIHFVNEKGETEDFIHADDIWETLFKPIFGNKGE